MLEAYLKILEEDYFELQEAFKGLADENVWKRPAEGLLSVGELAGHMAYWEAVRLAGEGENLDKCRVSSPLIDRRFRYYSSSVAGAPSDEHPALSAKEVCDELLRVHNESLAHFTSLSPDLESTPPGLPGWTYGSSLRYLLFHIAYHTGQIYSARHLLGEVTVDN